jgi:hypothetical protein
MVTRILIALCLLATVAQGQVMRRDDSMNHWPAEDRAAKDLAGTNSGTLVGSPSFKDGRFGSSFNFTSATSYVSLGLHTMPTAATITVWLRLSTIPTTDRNYMLFAAKTTTYVNGMFSLYARPVSGTFRLRSETGSGAGAANYKQWEIVPSPALTSNVWYFLVFSEASTTATPLCWINGIRQTVNLIYTQGSTPIRLNLQTAIGYDGDVAGSGWGLGEVDELRVYNRVFSSSDVKSRLFSRRPTQ